MNNAPWIIGIVLGVIIYIVLTLNQAQQRISRQKAIDAAELRRAAEKASEAILKTKKTSNPKAGTYKIEIDPESDWKPVLINDKTGEIIEKSYWQHTDPSKVFFGN